MNLLHEEDADVTLSPDDVIARAVETHDPSHVFALVSGGHDSLCAAHVASRHPRFAGCVHVNTGIGIEETRDFVRETCREFGWPLLEYAPPVPYDEIVLRHGFPGPGQHPTIYARLKERPLRRLTTDYKRGRGDRVMLITGVRRQESSRRMGTVKPVQRDGARVWVAPLVDFSHADKAAYMADHSLPENPVVQWCHMSGECFCGAFAGSKHGSAKKELDWARAAFPAIGDRVDALERKAAAAGVWHRWGEAPPTAWTNERKGQLALPMLCTSCELRSVTA